ncbi:MAG: 3-phosphoshikimate 1-carboxyvinyltransferase [Lentisphaerae bacterium]|jgi:3-phosphoshikimate 1-carboxyvinyltransferase|nr:3-phosphoshikimate 1-carboxyvinyltransferase [Lentisphaerota bacterium]
MQKVIITPCHLEGRVTPPPSKSFLHRGLFCSALAGDLSLCEIPASYKISVDVAVSLQCLKQLLAAEKSGERIILNCRESGTTLRFIIPVLAALGIEAVVKGEGRLPSRPLAEYEKVFGNSGINLVLPGNGKFLPLEISGKLSPGTFHLPGGVSSQYFSGLLLALSLLDSDSEIVITTPLESEPYVNMTLDVMKHFGVAAKRTERGYLVPGKQQYRTDKQYVAEVDFSQASFWLLAAYLGHDINVENLPERTSQGDSAFSSILKEFLKKTDDVCEIDVSQTPDIVPPLAAAASASGRTAKIINAKRLRYKESDRIESTLAMLHSFGVHAESFSDGMIIYPHKLPYSAGVVDGAGDHRIVMTAAVMATRASGEVTINGSNAITKSYPDFFEVFRAIGGRANELDLG